MDSKQRKKLFEIIYKACFVFVLVFLVVSGYFVVFSLIHNIGFRWFNIILTVFSILVLLEFLTTISNLRKIKNYYKNSIFTFFVLFLSILGIIATVTVIYLKSITLPIECLLTIVSLMISQIIISFMILIGVQFNKIIKNTTIVIDDVAEVPNQDDEIKLKKQLDEMNRKLEMKKISDQIDEIKKKLEQ